jgi:hypothetical protein
MRTILSILGALFAMAGIVWFLQGIGVLPGSFMSGQTQWAISGGAAFIIGLGLLAVANRRRAGAKGE